MNRTVATALLAAILLVRPAAAGTPDLAPGITAFTQAFNAWNGGQFASAAEAFSKAAAASPHAAAPRYWQGVTHFHHMLYFQSLPDAASHAAQADSEMTAAITALETAVELDASHAESHALLGTLYGMKIRGSTLRAIRYGPRVHQHHQLALRHGPQNPRVRYLSGAGLFHTADGAEDFKKALAELRLAEKAFASEAARPAQPGQPRWAPAVARRSSAAPSKNSAARKTP